MPTLTETSFDEWKVEVEAVLKSGMYQERIVSFSGQTRKTLVALNPTAWTQEIIDNVEYIW